MNILILTILIFNIDRNSIYLAIIASFFNDTIAYIIGNFIKGPLITPKISPKKTWSGTSISFLLTTFFLFYLDFSIFIALLMSISLFYGDIYFSFIKRKLNIKDFSSILSSHGGILDRIDSITFLLLILSVSSLYNI